MAGSKDGDLPSFTAQATLDRHQGPFLFSFTPPPPPSRPLQQHKVVLHNYLPWNVLVDRIKRLRQSPSRLPGAFQRRDLCRARFQGTWYLEDNDPQGVEANCLSAYQSLALFVRFGISLNWRIRQYLARNM